LAGVTGGDSILLSDASQIPQVVLNLIEGQAKEEVGFTLVKPKSNKRRSTSSRRFRYMRR